MKFVCPRTWDDLAEMGRQNVRHCFECGKDVHFCATDEETLAHARQGHCIAREEPHASELPRVVVGRPAGPIVPTEEQRAAQRWRARERGITAVLGERLDASRDCPRCGYPVQDFRTTCHVCSHELGRAE
jgi:predicted amidophosphoribosyltransferase